MLAKEKMMSEQDKNEVQDNNSRGKRNKKEPELTSEERKRLKERITKAKDIDPNIYPLW